MTLRNLFSVIPNSSPVISNPSLIVIPSVARNLAVRVRAGLREESQCFSNSPRIAKIRQFINKH